MHSCQENGFTMLGACSSEHIVYHILITGNLRLNKLDLQMEHQFQMRINIYAVFPLSCPLIGLATLARKALV